jgi:hypothetical protein
MSPKLKVALFFVIGISIWMKYILPQSQDNEKMYRKNQYLTLKLMEINQRAKHQEEIKAIVSQNQKILKGMELLFYRGVAKYTTSMIAMQKDLKKSFLDVSIKDVHIKWIEEGEKQNILTPLRMEVTLITSPKHLVKWVKHLEAHPKYFYIETLKMHTLGGALKEKALKIVMNISAYRLEL